MARVRGVRRARRRLALVVQAGLSAPKRFSENLTPDRRVMIGGGSGTFFVLSRAHWSLLLDSDIGARNVV
ncbi:MAG TPA: hypothetical protein DGG94_10005 [Micromonosporaceae bacterium]|nr:hypothetical protein [Micromonosporaceae bacterium]HCU50116.1 hypothetical protein [Micromonosporaceae bacterium]